MAIEGIPKEMTAVQVVEVSTISNNMHTRRL